MCASIYSFLLLFTTTLTNSVFYGRSMVTEGLPLVRQERSASSEDILAGADFLSLFMKSYNSRTVEPTTYEPQIRETRSTDAITASTEILPQMEETISPILSSESIDYINYNSNSNYNNNNKTSDNSVIVAVKVSSSSSRTFKDASTESTTIFEETTNVEQNIIASEEHPAVVAKAGKSEFSVEEHEPITTNSDLSSAEFSRDYPANVQSLPMQNSQYPQPFHQTLIFHNQPGKARSVSFSTVIQALPNPQHERNWEEEEKNHERHERHYEGVQTVFNNNFDDTNKKNDTKQEKKLQITTEKNWEQPERRLPTVYGQPEQNYEVDESASVMTNGRIHGIQSITQKPEKNDSKKLDDNQKVGYVVEGRNYRKYRVEERTSDGFIVGEYGVVSHDDGSLRGVRYTADGTINPRLIYDALMKFLSL